MIDRGANPFVSAYSGHSQIGYFNLGSLSYLPAKKSVYFTIRPIVAKFKGKTPFRDPWFYRTGIFDGKFNSIIGKGASGIVFSGKWCGMKAAFNFVEIGVQKFRQQASEALKTLNENLTEMTSIQQTEGSKILSFYGHYR